MVSFPLHPAWVDFTVKWFSVEAQSQKEKKRLFFLFWTPKTYFTLYRQGVI
jgi:hypothetical protein